jgi:hypothetical protein
MKYIPDSLPTPSLQEDIDRTEKAIAFYVTDYLEATPHCPCTLGEIIQDIKGLAELPANLRNREVSSFSLRLTDNDEDTNRLFTLLVAYLKDLQNLEKEQIKDQTSRL